MNCHNCESPLDWDGYSPIVVCDLCCAYRFVDTPDDTANRIVSLERPGIAHCPICRSRTSEAATDGIKVEHCADCHGLLLTDDTFDMYVRNRRTEFREAALQSVNLVDEQLTPNVHCPSCRRQMDVHPCYGPNFLIVDTCTGCGMVWLDCSETELACQLTPSESLLSSESIQPA